jgi:hypothetical protein
MSTCSLCGTNKDDSFFYKDRTKASGLRSQCIECTKKSVIGYKKENPERFKAYSNNWYYAHKEELDAQNRKRQKEHPEYGRRATSKYQKKIMATPRGKLDQTMARGIRLALQGSKNGRTWESLVGYTVDDLMKHLERKFKPGMTWENQGKWHLDHKIPKAAHYYERPDDIDFKRCWSLNNLQPLWARENIMKRDKVERPHQPSLALAI